MVHGCDAFELHTFEGGTRPIKIRNEERTKRNALNGCNGEQQERRPGFGRVPCGRVRTEENADGNHPGVDEAVHAGERDIGQVTLPADPMAMPRSRSYLMLLALAAVIGVPVSAVAYGFLALASYLQKEIFTHLPNGLGFQSEPVWWPLSVLAAGGALTA